MSGRIRCTVTRYGYGQDGVATTSTRVEHAGFHIERGYVHLHNSEASAPFGDLLRNAREKGRDWLAQAGTPPVYVAPCPRGPRPCGGECGCGPGDDVGGWGGRNYPEIRVSAEDIISALDPPKEAL